MAYTFDGINKVAILSSNTLDMRDFWSRWIDWVHTGDNSKYALWYSAVWGNDIDPASGTSIPCYIFQINGWKIRPREANHTLTVTNGILVDLTWDPFTNTLSIFRVNIRYQQPVQAITVATGGSTGGGSGLTPEQVAMIEAMNEKIDVKVSSRASTGAVRNISMDGWFTKDDRKLLEGIEKVAKSTDKKVDTVQTTLESLTDTVIENFGDIKTGLENMSESGKALIDSAKKTIEAIEKIEIRDYSEELRGIKSDILSAMEQAEESNIKLVQLLGMTSSGLVKEFSELLKNGFFDIKVAMEKEKKEQALVSSKHVSSSEMKLMEHISLGIKYLSDRLDTFDTKIEQAGAKDFTISIEEDE